MKYWLKALGALIVFLSIFSAPSAFAGPIYSFSTAGASGVNGPTSAQVTAAYTGTNLAGTVSVVTQGIQQWTVPTTGEYFVEVAGASGGYSANAIGGRGRIIKTRLTLTAGTQLKIAVGQEGGRAQFTGASSGGGGGGTFIYNVTSASWLAVSGGGGGAAQGTFSSVSSTQPGVDASAYSVTSGAAGTGYSGSYSGAGAGGTAGGGGTSGGGGGITGNGANGPYSAIGGKSFSNNLVGGAAGIAAGTTEVVAGGFGGGCGASVLTNYEVIGGGGGGYSGGGGGATRIGAGGGGGNFYSGTYVSDGLNTGNGYATFQLIANPTVTLATAGNVTSASKGATLVLTATIDDTVKITFYADGKRIAKCINLSATAGTITCSWKPTVQKVSTVYAVISQAGSVVATSSRIPVRIIKKTTLR